MDGWMDGWSERMEMEQEMWKRWLEAGGAKEGKGMAKGRRQRLWREEGMKNPKKWRFVVKDVLKLLKITRGPEGGDLPAQPAGMKPPRLPDRAPGCPHRPL